MDTITDLVENLSKRKIKTLINDPVKTAEAVNLIYVSDTSPGITRKKSGNFFNYFLAEEKLKIKRCFHELKAL